MRITASATVRGRVLVIDDRASGREALVAALRHAGAVAAGVGDVATAGAVLRAARLRGADFDVVLVRVGEGARQHLAAAVQLRWQGFSGRVVAVATCAAGGVAGACFEAGCDDLVEWPATPSDLAEVLRRNVFDEPVAA